MKRYSINGLLAFCLLNAALANADLQPRIANGLLTFDYPEVVALVNASGENAGVSFCTGTLIGCNTVLTAAHCVCDGDGPTCQQGGADLMPADEIIVYAQNAPLRGVSSVHVPQNFSFAQAGDVAVLKLSRALTGIAPATINPAQEPAPGSRATLVGFGLTGEGQQFEDSGLKRFGRVTLLSCPSDIPGSQFICYEHSPPFGPAGQDSAACVGDSGGPMFVDSGPRVLVGVTAGGFGLCHVDNEGFYSDVSVNRAYIQSIAGADLNNTSCGNLPQAGQGAPIIPFAGQLGNSAVTHSFSVPADTQRLRVNLNADESQGTDFDLLVKAGSAPTANNADCVSENIGVFEDCEFTNPVPGTWFARIVPFAGSGDYQLSATLFPASGGISGKLINVSTNGFVADGSGLIAGFIVSSGSKRYAITGERAGSTPLNNAFIELINLADGQIIASNDNWQSSGQAAEIQQTIDRPLDSVFDAGLMVTLGEGLYGARLKDAGGGSGTGLVSVTEVANSGAAALINVSTNGFVLPEGMVAGFIVSGGNKRYAITAESKGLPALPDAFVELIRIGTGQVIASNNNWQSNPATAAEIRHIIGRGLDSPSDAGLIADLGPGLYGARIKDISGGSGFGLISVTQGP